jgi:hypothetical protein
MHAWAEHYVLNKGAWKGLKRDEDMMGDKEMNVEGANYESMTEPSYNCSIVLIQKSCGSILVRNSIRRT